MMKSLSARLRLGVGAIILTFSLSGFVSIAGIVVAARGFARVIDSGSPAILAIDQMEASILRQSLLVLGYSESCDPSVLSEMYAERRRFTEGQKELASLDNGAISVNTDIYQEYDDFVALQHRLVDEADAFDRINRLGTETSVLTSIERKIAELQEDISTVQADLLRHFEETTREPIQTAFQRARDQASSAAWRSIAIFGFLMLAAIAIGIGTGSLILRGLKRPLASLTEAMGRIASGDRTARLENTGISEVQELESSFNDMAERLDEAEQGIKRSYKGQRKILDEIPVGFLTMGPSCRVDPEYSAATERIFGRTDLAGVAFTDLIYPDGDAAKVDELSRYLRQLFSNTTADQDFLDEINPIRSIVVHGTENERDVEIVFDRIYEDGAVSDILVTIEDKTEVLLAGKALEDEQRARKRDADSIQAILSIGPGPLNDFFAETREMVARIRENLGKLDDIEVVHATFRLLHSIKGMAGSFGLEAVAATAHETEDIFAGLRESRAAPTTQDLIRVNTLLGLMCDELDAFEDFVARLKAALLKLEEKDRKGESEDELGEFVSSLEAMVAQLEKSLSKSMDFIYELKVRQIPHLREMKNVIIHLIRNSIDHGIEDEFERLFQGKPKRGRIRLSVRKKAGVPNACLVEIEDDGQGINFDRIAEKAVAQGLLPESEAKNASRARLLAFLFMPGFSTKEKADEISGRGVGLDLVRDTVKSFGGSISVSSARGKGTRFSVVIPA